MHPISDFDQVDSSFMLKRVYTLTGALAGRGIAIIGALLLALAIGRMVGAEGLGTFALCQAALNILSVVGRAGFDRTVTRYVGGLPACEVVNRKRDISHAMRGIFLANIALGGFAWLIAWLALRGTRYASVLELWPIFCFLIPVYSLTMIFSGYFRGVKAPGTAALMEAGSASFGAALMIGGLLLYGWPVSLFDIGLIFAASSCLTLLGGFILFRRSPGHQVLSTSDYGISSPDFRLEASLPFMLITLIPFLNQFVPLFASGAILSPVEAGLFRVSERATLILSGPLIIISAILPPYILELYRAGKLAQIRRLLIRISFLTAPIGGLLLLLCIVARAEIVSLFGPEFRPAGDAFAIMALGQFVNLATGAVGLTLMMIHQERWVRDVNGVLAIAGIILYPIAFTSGGLLGGAVIYSLLLLVQGIILSVLVFAFTDASHSQEPQPQAMPDSGQKE